MERIQVVHADGAPLSFGVKWAAMNLSGGGLSAYSEAPYPCTSWIYSSSANSYAGFFTQISVLRFVNFRFRSRTKINFGSNSTARFVLGCVSSGSYFNGDYAYDYGDTNAAFMVRSTDANLQLLLYNSQIDLGISRANLNQWLDFQIDNPAGTYNLVYSVSRSSDGVVLASGTATFNPVYSGRQSRLIANLATLDSASTVNINVASMTFDQY